MNDLKNFDGYKLFTIGLAFYFYQYLIRLLPGVMINDLVVNFHISPKEFSHLGSLYLYSYSLLQIPIGILLDKYSIKKIFILSIIICIIGTILFAFAKNLFILKFARVLQGVGSASAFTGTIKIVADYFPEGKRGFLTGISLAVGVAGALCCCAPVTYLLVTFGFSCAIAIIAFFGVILLLAVFFVSLSAEKPDQEANEGDIEKTGVKVSLFFDKRLIIYSILATGLYAPIAIFSDLWGTGFLMLKYDMPRAVAAHASTVTYIGLFFGSIFIPKLFEKTMLQSIRFILFGLFLTFAMVIFYNELSIIYHLLFLLGFLAGGEMLCFAAGVIGSNRNDSGTRVGILNTINMLLSGVMQQFIGVILGYRCSTFVVDNFMAYKYEDFAMAFTVVLFLVFICFIMSIKLKD